MRLWILSACLLWVASVHSAPKTPGDSIYQLPLVMTTQDNQQHSLDMYRGKLTLVSMFYASCPDVCPLLIDTLKQIDRQLSAAERKQLRVLLVSLDPKRDTPAALQELAGTHRMDLSRWSVAQTSVANVQKLAAVLGVQYRQLPDGNFNHSSIITLLDRDGRMIGHTSTLGHVEPEFVKKLHTALQGP